jgi:hypothetical protein
MSRESFAPFEVQSASQVAYQGEPQVEVTLFPKGSARSVLAPAWAEIRLPRARSEKREARSEKREARSEKREARSEKREARSM